MAPTAPCFNDSIDNVRDVDEFATQLIFANEEIHRPGFTVRVNLEETANV